MLSRLALDIDSFEIIMPTAGHVPDYRNVAADTAMDLPDKADHYARDNVGIMKPPDVTWWPWLLLAGLLVGFCMVIWLKKRGR